MLLCLILYNFKYQRKFYLMKSQNKQKTNVYKQKIGQDVIDSYKSFKNNETKWKNTILSNVSFDLPQYYKPVSLIGAGAYGAVAIAQDERVPQAQREQNMVAIKKMTNAFQHKIYARRVLRQLKLLRLLRHQNIVQVKTIILPKSRQGFEDIYVVFQVMDSDIFRVIKKGDQNLTEPHFQYFLYQILRGLMYIHSCGVIHRDIKTRNLLINADCNVKICDFGLARLMMKTQKVEAMTDYVATRWYRAPQLLLGQTNYSPAVDIWSVGCIFAELITKKPFLPASTTKQQLELICQMIDTSDIESLKKQNGNSYEILSKIIEKRKKKKSISLIDEKIKNVSPQAIDLLKKFLAFDPQKRISAKQAINHPYFTDFREPELQIEGQSLNSLQFEFQMHSLTTQQLKDIIYEQILLYHFPAFSKKYYEKLNNNQSVLTQILKNSNSSNINPYTDADDDEEFDE